MTKIKKSKIYDLEERTYRFAEKCRDFVKRLPRTIDYIEYSKQLIKSSASVAANYIEANEAISRKDFSHRIKICRKEAKESRLWLKLCRVSNEGLKKEQENLINETIELTKIFGSILEKIK